MKNLRAFFILLLMAVFFNCAETFTTSNTDNIPSPEENFGFKIGTDKMLAHPEEMVAYFEKLDEMSDRMVFKEVGRTTDDNPFVMAIISSEANIRDLDKYKEMNAKLADPRNLSETEARDIIKNGKTIIGINAGIHSTEVGPPQAAIETIHKLVTENSDEVRHILDNVILIFTPMHNPDGYKMVVDWWRKYKGTEYEGSGLPYLYQRYVGHDNNRDWYMFTQKETQLTIKHLYDEWHPQIVVDMHQMGSGGARLFVPPFTGPYEPNIDPIITANVNMMGTYMLNRLTGKGLKGVESFNRYDAWTPGRAFQHYHGSVRILTETASALWAAPRENDEALQNANKLERDVFYPNPWRGEKWTLGDIVQYNIEAAMASLENAASLRRVWLSNFYEIGKNAIAEGGKPYAVVIPVEQRDKYTTKWLHDVLQTGLVEIHKASSDFSAGGKEYKAGSSIIYMNQPYYSFAKTLLERQVYPEKREYPGGPLSRPYDLVAHTLPLLMGIEVAWINEKFEAKSNLMSGAEIPEPAITMGSGDNGFILPIESNGTYIAVNRLLNEDFPVYWSGETFIDGNKEYPQGTVIVFNKDNDVDKIKTIAKELHIDLVERQSANQIDGYQLSPVKLGLYKSWSGNMNEGWTRWVMEKFEYNMESAHNDVIKAGDLNTKYNAILLSNFRERDLLNGRRDNAPPEYTGGIGKNGLENLKQFVRAGGTLITYGASNDFAIKHFSLRIQNDSRDISNADLYIPGSILSTINDTNHPIAFGVPKENIVFYRNANTFAVSSGKVISRYPQNSKLLLSGWMEGGHLIAGKPNLVETSYGNGRIVMIGFDPIYRAQAQSTFKYIFNAMHYGAAKRTTIPVSNKD